MIRKTCYILVINTSSMAESQTVANLDERLGGLVNTEQDKVTKSDKKKPRYGSVHRTTVKADQAGGAPEVKLKARNNSTRVIAEFVYGLPYLNGISQLKIRTEGPTNKVLS
jgi:hypothetical protein